MKLFWKIDKSFIDDIITMAHSLELKVIAEGVETKQQLQQLSAQRCHASRIVTYSKT